MIFSRPIFTPFAWVQNHFSQSIVIVRLWNFVYIIFERIWVFWANYFFAKQVANQYQRRNPSNMTLKTLILLTKKFEICKKKYTCSCPKQIGSKQLWIMSLSKCEIISKISVSIHLIFCIKKWPILGLRPFWINYVNFWRYIFCWNFAGQVVI